MSGLLSLQHWGSSFARQEPESRCQECNSALAQCFDNCCRTPTEEQTVESSLVRWTRHYLRSRSASCTFCAFLLYTWKTNPRLKRPHEVDEDELCLRNSRELGTAYRRNANGSKVEGFHYYWPALHNYEPDHIYDGLPENVHLLPYWKEENVHKVIREPVAFMLRRLCPYIDLDLVGQWIRCCSETHQDHPFSNPCTTGEWPEQLSDCIRFVDTELLNIVQRSTACEYVALSYVWGRSKTPFMLNDGTIERLSKAGALTERHGEIPQTYIDAIHVCQKLGYRYLWIDAICIKQDSPSDKAAQVQLMDAIYRGASLTLVNDAPAASSGIAGISRTRDESAFSAASLYKPKDNSDFGIGLALPSYGKAVQESIWETRGWTLQEKIFSTRILLMSAQQAYFHCRHMTCAEDTVLEAQTAATATSPDTITATTTSIHLSERYDSAFSKPDDPHQQRALLASYSGDHKFWGPETFKEMLANYVARQLSFPQDTVAAFAGMLRQFGAGALAGAHLHGHPLAFFAYVANWRVRGTGVERREGFPSWSWAGWAALPGEGGVVRESWIRFNGNPRSEGASRVVGNAIEWFRYCEEARDWLPIPASKRARLDHPFEYGIAGHPGSKDFVKCESLPALELCPQITPSHILRFYTSTCSVLLDRTHEHLCGQAMLVRCTRDGVEADRDSFNNDIVEIQIPQGWSPTHTSSGHAPLELIVVAQERRIRRGEEAEELALLLVEQNDDDIMYRVNMAARSLGVEQWKKLDPVWRCGNLA